MIECPKCHSNSITVQVVNESKLVNAHHSILWWITIGWIWVLSKWMVFTIPALIFKIFGVGKRKKIVNITKKKGVCQNCGAVFDLK